MIKFFVHRPILTFSVFGVLFLVGIFSVRVLPLDLFPDISVPMASIVTLRPGASPPEIEEEITKYIEDAVSTVPDVKEIKSISLNDISVVTVEFDWGTDIDEAVNDIRSNLEITKYYLPDDAETPKVFKFDLEQIPILIGAFSVKDTLFDLRTFFEEEIKEKLMRIKGVGEVQFWGGGRKEVVKVSIKRKYIEELGITPFVIKEAILSEHRDIPLGNVEESVYSISFKIRSKFRDIEDLKNVPIYLKDKGIFYLRDIADIELTYDDPVNKVRTNKIPSLIFGVNKKAGANTVEVAERVKREVKRILAKYPFIELTIVNDISRFIRSSVQNLTTTIYWAVFFIFLTILFFLRHLFSSFAIIFTIPFSIFAGFILLKLTGGSINIISLSSLALASGLVVDNAVVVLENIFFRRERGEKALEAAYKGAGEVFAPILASTLTTIAIFAPLVIGTGFVGIMFKQLASTIAVVLLTSLIVSVTLTPVLSRVFIRNVPERKGFFYNIFDRLKRIYEKVLVFSLKRSVLFLFFGFLFFLTGVLLFVFGVVKTEFFPVSDTGELRGYISLAPGTKLAVTDSVGRKIEDIIDNMEEINTFTVRVGRSAAGFGAVMGVIEGENTAMFYLNAGPMEKRKKTVFEIAEELKEKISGIPGIRSIYITPTGAIQHLIGGFGAPIEVSVYGENLDLTDSIAMEIKRILEKIDGITTVRITRERGLPEISLLPIRERLKEFGLSSSIIGLYLRTLNFGDYIGTMDIDGREVDIKIVMEEKYRKDLDILPFLSFPLGGEKVYIDELFKLRYGFAPLSIERENKERVVKVEAEYGKRALGEIREEVQEKIKDFLGFKSGFRVEIGGLAEEEVESFRILFYAFLLGILIVYLVMAAQFESFLLPFIIMFTVPSGITGVALIHIIRNIPFSIPSFVGMIMMIGIVVNNAIVMLDLVERLRKKGKTVYESIKEGALRRFRPILITSFTTIMALVPLTLFRIEGSETWMPLATSVIGGLFFSLVVSLVFIPCMYLFVQRKFLKRN